MRFRKPLKWHHVSWHRRESNRILSLMAFMSTLFMTLCLEKALAWQFRRCTPITTQHRSFGCLVITKLQHRNKHKGANAIKRHVGEATQGWGQRKEGTVQALLECPFSFLWKPCLMFVCFVIRGFLCKYMCCCFPPQIWQSTSASIASLLSCVFFCVG